MDDFLTGLNSAQHAAVTSEALVLQVLAPPGSGKTKTLTARVAHLIAQRGFKPWNVVVCTFTVKAAKEMKERIKHIVGEKQAKQLQLGTFHSVSLRYLKQYGHLVGVTKDFGIADSSDSKAVVARIIKQKGLNLAPGAVRSRISTQKAHGVDSQQFSQSAKSLEQREFAEVFSDYDAALRASRLLDYDDLLLRSLDLFRSHPACVSNIQAVLIDEFQDTNNIQYDLMGSLAQYCNQITIVGDPDQSIYGFRAAEIQNLSRMKQRWADTLTINLEENYRSSGGILHAAQNIIEQDESRPPKKLQATHSPGLRPVLRMLPAATAEADWLVSEVTRLRGLSGGLLRPSDFAILLRAASLSRVLESALGKAGIPYRMVGGTRFYSRVEVKLMIDYLRVVSQPEDDEAVERIINVPSRKVGNASIASLQGQARTKGLSLWRVVVDLVQGRTRSAAKLSEATMKGLSSFVDVILSAQNKLDAINAESASLVDLVNLLIKKLNVQQWLKLKYPDDYEARWANVEEVIAQAIDLSDPAKVRAMLEDEALPTTEGADQEAATLGMADTLALFLNNIALSSSAEEASEKDGEKPEQLTISTIHAAKGLEWPVVFIPACYDGSIPHSRAEDADEERRLLYVGMTRAQVLLYLSRPCKNTQKEETTLSPFLSQPGTSSFFEEHGPSIVRNTLVGLANTLSRECPSVTAVIAGKKELLRDEDNYWPLTGEYPYEQSSRHDAAASERATNYASQQVRPLAGFCTAATTMQKQGQTMSTSMTMNVGFTSVSARYEELMEQSHLRKVDERAAKKFSTEEDKPKGRRKQLNGQSTIASFFAGPERTACAARSQEPSQAKTAIDDNLKRPFREINNLQSRAESPPRHRPRTVTTKLSKTVTETIDSDNAYVFLSSSPQKPDAEDRKPAATKENTQTSTLQSASLVRQASTFHVTSMQSIGPPRKTLGMRRSLQGWTAKPMRRPGT